MGVSILRIYIVDSVFDRGLDIISRRSSNDITLYHDLRPPRHVYCPIPGV